MYYVYIYTDPNISYLDTKTNYDLKYEPFIS